MAEIEVNRKRHAEIKQLLEDEVIKVQARLRKRKQVKEKAEETTLVGAEELIKSQENEKNSDDEQTADSGEKEKIED